MVNPRISVVFRGFHSDILINPYGFNFFAIFVSNLISFPPQRSGSECSLSDMSVSVDSDLGDAVFISDF